MCLKGIVMVVMEECKNQVFVVDIMGVEQIFRMGDGDVVLVFCCVMGLMLVDGKFIYVCGLGECYLLMQLNGVLVLSFDLMCNVILLDLFLLGIIESLFV